ncbi:MULTISPECIES: carboxylesterase/lipase family protein [Microbacterium]|uniref:carboxylesterase/lipase family protein n=1 Tax=Microbacterium TaxID=33882 RepID=UPI001D176A54|nr:carboxylesterase family protein [Microbacterium testaceum]MCC4247526.1 carboxylesterase family protein [Microbacterium testaceum]
MTVAPVIATARGRVRGFTRGGTAVFLGIPFAQAPVGARRFAAPQPVEPWDGELDATEYGATAQRGDTGITLIPEPSIPGDATLNVNVFTPADATPDAGLPVLVWIHGGGFVSGSPASRWYDGDAFARDGVVTVVLSYRLGFDGFGAIEGAPSNRGLRDQIAALEWVRDEIRAFGGDPARVTIAGQSAGGGSVLALLACPAASGLFAGAMALSPALGAVSADAARRFAERVATLAGVHPDRAGFASLPEEKLLELQRLAQKPERRARLSGLSVLLNDGLPLGPVVDGDLLPRSPLEALADGASANVPFVVGATDDEFTMITARARRALDLVPVPLALALLGLGRSRRRAYLARSPRRGGAARLGGYVSDRVIRSVVLRAARARGTASTWLYRFAWTSPSIGHACHCLDVPFWFDHLDADGVTAIAGDAPPAELADAMHAAAVRFVRDGDPGWPAWDAETRRARVFGGSASGPDVETDAYADVAPLV